LGALIVPPGRIMQKIKIDCFLGELYITNASASNEGRVDCEELMARSRFDNLDVGQAKIVGKVHKLENTL
jgi:hypothetical protein